MLQCGSVWFKVVSREIWVGSTFMIHTQPQVQTLDTRPFCSFFTIASKSPVFFEDLSSPVEMKARITGPEESGTEERETAAAARSGPIRKGGGEFLWALWTALG